MVTEADQAEINKGFYSRREGVSAVGDTTGWLDPGEQAALLSVASSVRGRPILDLGVGGGRTTALLSLLSDDYLGIDFSPTLVAHTRKRFPRARIEQGDARDLSALPSSHFGLVLFSFNGIDCVPHADRPRALGEIRRVLAPGGQLVISTINKDGPRFAESPWTLVTPAGGARSSVRQLARLAAGRTHFFRSVRAWLRLRHRIEDHADWGTSPLLGVWAGLVVHFTTLPAAVSELNEAGFEVTAAFSNSGESVTDLSQRSTESYFHFVTVPSGDGSARVGDETA